MYFVGGKYSTSPRERKRGEESKAGLGRRQCGKRKNESRKGKMTNDVHCKEELAIFPSPAGMSLTKLSLGGKKLNYSRPGRV